MYQIKQNKNYTMQECYVLFFALLPFLSVAQIRTWMGDHAYQLWQFAGVGMMLALLAMEIHRVRFDLFVFGYTIYAVEIFVVSCVNRGFSPGTLVVTVGAITVVMLIQARPDVVLRALTGLIALLVPCNFISMLLSVHFSSDRFFLGGKNALSMFLIPAACLLLIFSLNRFGKFRVWEGSLAAMCFVCVFWGGSGTGIVTAGAALILLFVFLHFRPNIPLFLGVIALLYLLLTVFSEQLFSSSFWQSFVGMLDKDETLTSRTTIWEQVMKYFRASPSFGVGRGASISYVNAYGLRNTVYEAHNFVLEILLEGGIFAFAAYLLSFLSAVCRLRMNDKKQRVIFLAIAAILINGLTESNNNHFFVIMLVAFANAYADGAPLFVKYRKNDGREQKKQYSPQPSQPLTQTTMGETSQLDRLDSFAD